MSVPTSETSLLVWYCQACRKSCKVQPPTEEPACRCAKPVPGLRPTTVTVLATPKSRPLRALDDEEARLLGLARTGTKVRITFEAEVADAVRWSGAGRSGIDFVVTSPDGRRHTVNGSQPGLRIEAVPDDGE